METGATSHQGVLMSEEIYCPNCGPLLAELCFSSSNPLEVALCPKCGAPAEYHWLANDWKFETRQESMAKMSRADFDAHQQRVQNAIHISKMDALKRMSQDHLRERIQALSPEIAHEVNVMADLIREMVALERDKDKSHPNYNPPTRKELQAWAASSAHLYNDPTFQEWLANYRAAHPHQGVIELWERDPKTKNTPTYLGKGSIEGRRYKSAGFKAGRKLKIIIQRD
jgi:hypothetical protein